MIRNFVYVIIFIMIVVPAWQISSIKMEKLSIEDMLQQAANKSNKYRNSDSRTRENLKKDLESKGLSPVFTFETLEGKNVRISYQYYGAATVFGYTYYETSENLSAETSN
ncbi:hypothetical protein [Desulfopila sp. IMCC35008]|uniref:hypothetical protein n=1 Tax=Desulfopila sp. IMCC35008 TaxID=2653858 RepID=UPI0013D787D2|nr:hypothetical protein [Desulfopila sp. IMCC35008]